MPENLQAVDSPAVPSLVDPFVFQRPLLNAWLRSTRATVSLLTREQELLRERTGELAKTLTDEQPKSKTVMARPWSLLQTLLESWVAAPYEAQRLIAEALIELRFSARELIGHLEHEHTALEQAEAERNRIQERLDREHTTRREIEKERDAARAEAERLDREVRRLERAQERERAAAESAEKPAVNVVRRDEDWAVVRDDAKRASGVFETKREAVERAREIARREGADLNV